MRTGLVSRSTGTSQGSVGQGGVGSGVGAGRGGRRGHRRGGGGGGGDGRAGRRPPAAAGENGGSEPRRHRVVDHPHRASPRRVRAHRKWSVMMFDRVPSWTAQQSTSPAASPCTRRWFVWLPVTFTRLVSLKKKSTALWPTVS